MQVNCALTSLDLRANDLGVAGAAVICSALKVIVGAVCVVSIDWRWLHTQANRTLVSIDLSLNRTGAEGVVCISDALKVVNSVA